MILKIWDNGGRTFDRYTIRVRNDYYGMSTNPNDPQGFNQYIGSYGDGSVQEGRHLGRLVYNCGKGQYMDLPLEVRKAIADRS